MSFTPPGSPAVGQDVLWPPSASTPSFSLLSVVRPLPLPEDPTARRATDGLPEKAIRLGHQRCIQARSWPNCPPDPSVYMDAQADDLSAPFFHTSWYVPVGCDNTPANQARFALYRQLAMEDVIAATSYMVESSIWLDGSLPAVQGAQTTMPSLVTAAQVIGDPTAAINPRDALGQLITAYRSCNMAAGDAVVHMPDVLLPYFTAWNTIEQVGSKLQAPGGFDVAIGGGYQERVGPTNSGSSITPEDVGVAWLYISGPIYMALGEPYVTADPTGRIAASGQMVQGYSNPRLNQQSVIAVRRAMYAFDLCCVYGIRVRIPSAATDVG